MSKLKKPGRVRLNCSRCGAPFSTHSSNRGVCFSCKPKCREIHTFNNVESKEGNKKDLVKLVE